MVRSEFFFFIIRPHSVKCFSFTKDLTFKDFKSMSKTYNALRVKTKKFKVFKYNYFQPDLRCGKYFELNKKKNLSLICWLDKDSKTEWLLWSFLNTWQIQNNALDFVWRRFRPQKIEKRFCQTDPYHVLWRYVLSNDLSRFSNNCYLF